MATDHNFRVKNGLEVGTGTIVTDGTNVTLSRDGSTSNRLRITNGNIHHDTNTIISGNLEVTGNFNIAGDVNQTSVTTLDVTDKTITVANNAGSAANANGAGIVVDTGTNNPQMIYTSATDEWDFNRSIDINGGSGTGLKIHSGGAIVGAKSGGDTQLMYWGGGPVYYGRSSLGGTVTGHEFRVGGTTKLNVDSSGDTVVSGNLKLTANDFLYTSGTNFDIKHTGSSQNITFHTTTSGGATSEIVRFTHNKRVGIGIASPDAPLHIEDSTSSAYGGLRVVGAGTGSGSTNVRQIADFGRTNSGSVSGVWLGGRTDETTAVIGAKTASGNIAFEVYNSGWQERMRITNAGNVGIGTASPTSLLHLSASSYPKITLNDETGVDRAFSLGTNNETFVIRNETASSNAVSIDQNNNVGIGTTAPNSLADLHVADTSDARIWLDATSGSTLELYAGSGTSIFNRSNSFLSFGVDNTEKMRINTGGNVGIGTTAPAAKLDVNGTIRAQGAITSTLTSSGGTFLSIGHSGNENWSFDAKSGSGVTDYVDFGIAGGTRCMTWQEDGNVGIGTNGPNTKLHVNKTSSGNFVEAIRIENSGGGVNEGAYINWEIANTSGHGARVGAQREGSGGIALRFDTGEISSAPVERMRIDHDGKVGIGTTAPLGKLSVGAGSINDAGLPVQISTGTDGTQAWYAVNRNGSYGALFGYSASSTYKGLVLRNVVSSGTANADGISFMTNNTSMRMHITGDGKVGIGTASPAQKFHVAAGYIHVDAGYGITWDDTFERIEQSDGHLEFFVNNGEAMTLDTYGLGIGTTAPQGRLHVAQSKGSAGHLWSQVGAGNTPSIHIQNTANTANVNAALYFRNSSAEKASIGARFVNQSTGQTELRFSVTNSSGTTRERMTLSGDGTLCLGESIAPNSDASMEIKTAAPNTGVTTLRLTNAVNNKGQRIDFYDDNAARAFTLSHDNGSNIAYMGTLVNESFTFYTNSAERMRIAADGLVAIGKTSLATWSSGYKSLQIGGRGFVGAHTGSDLYVGQNASFNSGWKYEASVAASLTQHSGGKITQFVAPAGTAGNAISWNRGIDINPTGEVAMGLVPTNGIALKIGNSANNSAITRVTNGTVHVDLTASSSGKAFLEVGTNHPLILATNATERMQITAAGNVGIGTSSPGDIRLKVHSNDSDDYIAIFKQTHSSNLGTVQIDTPSDSNARPSRLDFARGGVNKWKTGMIYGDTSNGWGLSDATGSGTALQQTRFLVKPDGKVGIGTTSPSTELMITGTAPMLRLQENSASSKRLDISISSSAVGIIGANQSASQLAFETTGSERMRITNLGNVGINTSNPYSGTGVTSMTVNAASYPVVSLQRADSNIFQILGYYNHTTFNASVGYMQFDTGSSERMRIAADGKVGIGTASPSSALHIQTNDSTTNSAVNSLMITNLSTGTTTTGFGGEIRFQAERNNGVMQNTGGIRSIAEVNSGTNISSGLAFDTSAVGVNSEKLRISYDGKVGIGTTAPSKQLTVSGADAEFLLSRTGGYADTINMGMPSGVPTIVGGTDLAFGGTGTWTEHMRIKANGNVGIGNTNPTLPLTVTSNSGANAIAIRARTADDYGFIQFYNHAGTAVRGQIFNHNGAMGISTDTTGTARLHIDTAGNVGIGMTTALNSKLNVFADGEAFRVDGSANTSRTIRFRNCGANGTSNAIIESDGILQLKTEDANAHIYINSVRDIAMQTTSANGTAGHFTFSSYNTEIMRIDGANNRVGIGTTAPGKKLEVAVTGNTDGIRIKGSSANTALVIHATGSGGNAWDISSTGSGHGYGSGDLNFGLSFGVPKVQFKANGNVGIGPYGTASGPHSKLHVEGDIGQQGTTDKSVSSGVADSGVNIITGVHASYARGSGRLRVMGTENNLNVGYAEYMYTYSTSSTGHYYINLKFIDESYVNNTYARPRLYLYNSSTYNNNATNRQNTNQSANSSNSNIGQIGITNVANQYGTFQIVAEPMHWKP